MIKYKCRFLRFTYWICKLIPVQVKEKAKPNGLAFSCVFNETAYFTTILAEKLLVSLLSVTT